MIGRLGGKTEGATGSKAVGAGEEAAKQGMDLCLAGKGYNIDLVRAIPPATGDSAPSVMESTGSGTLVRGFDAKEITMGFDEDGGVSFAAGEAFHDLVTQNRETEVFDLLGDDPDLSDLALLGSDSSGMGELIGFPAGFRARLRLEGVEMFPAFRADAVFDRDGINKGTATAAALRGKEYGGGSGFVRHEGGSFRWGQ